MTDWQYTRGLHDLGNGCRAWLQPSGSWGWSNAGLVSDGEASLLIDTLFDLPKTREMLAAMVDAVPAAGSIGTLVNTHANGDHCYGNAAVTGAEIVASAAGAVEIDELPPAGMARAMKLAARLSGLPWPLSRLPAGPGGAGLADFGRFFRECFGDFDFSDTAFAPPSRTFSGRLELTVGDTAVHLLEVGPAHTRGDVLVHVPSAATVFTGDILFSGGHPIVWAGPVSNYIAALRTVEALEPAVVVPGHGPIGDLGPVRRLIAYFEHISAEARVRFDAGLSVMDACRDISLDGFTGWGDPERIAVNVDTLYRELRGIDKPTHPRVHFARMARLAADRRRG